jgi:hypothetical protein
VQKTKYGFEPGGESMFKVLKVYLKYAAFAAFGAVAAVDVC